MNSGVGACLKAAWPPPTRWRPERALRCCLVHQAVDAAQVQRALTSRRRAASSCTALQGLHGLSAHRRFPMGGPGPSNCEQGDAVQGLWRLLAMRLNRRDREAWAALLFQQQLLGALTSRNEGVCAARVLVRAVYGKAPPPPLLQPSICLQVFRWYYRLQSATVDRRCLLTAACSSSRLLVSQTAAHSTLEAGGADD